MTHSSLTRMCPNSAQICHILQYRSFNIAVDVCGSSFSTTADIAQSKSKGCKK